MKFDIYEEVTNRIIAQLESGLIPWHKPWTGTAAGAISYATRKPYSLLNQMLLGKPGEYITFAQCKALGGKVKKGAKSRIVVFWKIFPKEEAAADGSRLLDSDGNPVVSGIPVLKYYNVFHLDECEGITPHEPAAMASDAEPDEAAEAVFASYLARSGVTFETREQDEAYYSPAADKIVLPLREQFASNPEYYSTLFHEATHSTGHKSRLSRFAPGAASARFGSQDYSKEELVAEIGAASILHELGMETPGTFRNSAAYIQSWLRALRNDKKLIVSAASKAEKAACLILNQ